MVGKWPHYGPCWCLPPAPCYAHAKGLYSLRRNCPILRKILEHLYVGARKDGKGGGGLNCRPTSNDFIVTRSLVPYTCPQSPTQLGSARHDFSLIIELNLINAFIHRQPVTFHQPVNGGTHS